MAIQWNESLSVGVKAIDDQHKELLLRFERLLLACQAGQGTEELKKLLAFLEEYVNSHFSDEEKLQVQHSYPEYEAHHAEHVYFIGQVNKLRTETDQEGVSTHHVIETNSMLLKWLINHISNVDKKLGAFLKAAKN